MSSTVRTAPTQEADLREVCQFLHEQLGRRFSASAWRESLLQNWASERPNFGTHLRSEGKVVGVLCAIYSDQVIDGKLERMCNPHSWVVLEEHRAHSIGLLLALLRQRDYHFTMFTPNPKVAKVFLGLRFREMDDRVLYIPNLPVPSLPRGRVVIEPRPDHIADVLTGTALKDFNAHRHLPWLRFVAFGHPGSMCLVIYKPARWKRLKCAAIAHASDPTVMATYGRALRSHLLLREACAFTRLEARHLRQLPKIAVQVPRGMPKLVLSPSLTDAQVTDLYSELMALDL